MIRSTNQRLAIFDRPAFSGVEFFWGYRAFIDWAIETFGDDGLMPEIDVVIADKGFIDRSKTVFSVNRSWGRLGRFVVNPRPHPIDIPPVRDSLPETVLQLGQDESDFSWRQDARDGRQYAEWLSQWPDRRFRPHPKVERSQTSLADDLAGAGLVVGLNTSALVAASMAGCQVEAFGPHSMAWGINSIREERLSWLRSIEFDRRDPAQVEAIAAALADPRRASECPEAASQTQASPLGSRKKRGKKKPARPARGKQSARSLADSDGNDGT